MISLLKMLSWLILLLIIDCIVGKTIYYDSKFGYDADRVRSRRQINFSKRKFQFILVVFY